MKTARGITTVVLLAAAFGCDGDPPPVPFPSEGGTQDLFYWLVEVANRQDESGTLTEVCPYGGEIEIVTALDEERDGSVVRLSGRWDMRFNECQPGRVEGGSIPGDPTIPSGYYTFVSETVIDADGRSFEASVEAEYDWVWGLALDPQGRVWTCEREWTDVSGEFAPYLGSESIEGHVCDGPDANVKVRARDFPGGMRGL